MLNPRTVKLVESMMMNTLHLIFKVPLNGYNEMLLVSINIETSGGLSKGGVLIQGLLKTPFVVIIDLLNTV